jgi:hypothetical protein
VLQVLGRPLVLKNAELGTTEWHGGVCRSLVALREALTIEGARRAWPRGCGGA